MSMPATGYPSSGWTVTSQVEGIEPGPDGQLTRGVTVYARTGSGTDFSVFVPQAQYSARIVQDMLGARAAVADQIAGLNGPAQS